MLGQKVHIYTSTEARHVILKEKFCASRMKILFIAGDLLYIVEILETDRST